ncbi:hypothetical protein ULMS_14120 [Patiriisocius marinistellae]|uniref:Tetratricopeptide repeat protein n=1 Tax=Patiriisocius marinistellae TaxID=2494560 RepID=A0A5J4FXM2_9FLAO|nr:hypothetical protein [Patiriisocius marinistellae]GEQ85904.1 hypothetical protein ULMS_14120 [Patiriisocius marinistellae]
MKTIIYITLLFVGFATQAQSKYEMGMQNALELWRADKPQEAANLFERIGAAEPTEWLPPFYTSQINVFKAFNEKDKAKITATLNKAQEFLNLAKTNGGGSNPEVMILEAQYYTAWIAFDGQQYGMQYAGKVAELYKKAAAISPDNPRVVMGKAEWDMGSAAYFGGDASIYCKDIKRAIELYKTEVPESSIHPSGGEEHAQDVLARNCGK